MATKKAAGTAKNLRDSQPKYLGVKKTAGQEVKTGQVIVRQRGTKIEAGKMRIDFGSQIRNYVLHPYKLVKDARTGVERTDASNVLDGDLDDFIKAFLLGAQEQQTQQT